MGLKSQKLKLSINKCGKTFKRELEFESQRQHSKKRRRRRNWEGEELDLGIRKIN